MVLLDTGTSGTSREIYSEDADDWDSNSTGNRNFCVQWNHCGTSRMRSQSQLRNGKYTMIQYGSRTKPPGQNPPGQNPP